LPDQSTEVTPSGWKICKEIMNICRTTVENLWYSETKRQHVQRYVETIFLVKLKVEENMFSKTMS
jgi:(2Fe-2S) ferredoxin